MFSVDGDLQLKYSVNYGGLLTDVGVQYSCRCSILLTYWHRCSKSLAIIDVGVQYCWLTDVGLQYCFLTDVCVQN